MLQAGDIVAVSESFKTKRKISESLKRSSSEISPSKLLHPYDVREDWFKISGTDTWVVSRIGEMVYLELLPNYNPAHHHHHHIRISSDVHLSDSQRSKNISLKNIATRVCTVVVTCLDMDEQSIGPKELRIVRWRYEQ